MLIIILIFAALAFLVIGGMYYDKKKNDEVSSKIRDSWEKDDELLFEHNTGKKITIEEAETGITVTESDLNRIRSDEELAYLYRGDILATEKIINGLHKKGYKLTSRETDFASLLSQSYIISQSYSWSFSYIVELSSDNFIMLGEIHGSLTNHSWVIILILSTPYSWGNYVALPVSKLERLIPDSDGNINYAVDGYAVRTISSGKEQSFINLVDTAPRLAATAIEAVNKNVFVFADYLSKEERLDDVLDLNDKLLKKLFPGR